MIDTVKKIECNLQSFVPRSARSLFGALLNHWFARILSKLSTDRLLLCSETYGSIGSNSTRAARVPDRPGCGRSSYGSVRSRRSKRSNRSTASLRSNRLGIPEKKKRGHSRFVKVGWTGAPSADIAVVDRRTDGDRKRRSWRRRSWAD